MLNNMLPKIEYVGRTDTGRRRSNNEDSFIMKPGLGFCALADGMGGASAGELASRMFVEAASEIFMSSEEGKEINSVDLVKRCFFIANKRIFESSSSNAEYKGMGCTAELIAFYNHEMVLGHVGDSRTYLFRNGILRQLSRDHSLVQNQLDEGIITEDQAKKHSLRHIILRAVGVKENVEVDITKGGIIAGDIILMCSDGLTDMIEDSLIGEVLSMSKRLDEKVDKLIESANDAGGFDNITVVLCEVSS